MSATAQKIATIVRCIERAREEHTAAGSRFKASFTHQDAALDRLASYLDQHAVPNDGMSMEMLDGYFHAVVIGPDTILPSEWLPFIAAPLHSGVTEWKPLSE